MKLTEKAGLLSDDQPMREQTPPRDTSPTYHTMDMENSGEFTHMALSDFSRQEKINISTMDATDNVTLSWRDIKVVAESKRGLCSCLKSEPPTPPKHILKNVSGVVKPGSLQVIMGGSGSGKTTLLNVLTRRNLGQLSVSGQVLVNGEAMGEDIASISAYIQQDDLFIGTITVREYLQFNAKLRMPPGTCREVREQKVADVMLDMGLLKCADTVIGSAGVLKSLSGGEMKRLVFAAAMLTSPSLLFCDEPTTGLDSFMAQNVVEALLALTTRGCTILCTIHQPSSQVYALFDQLLLMAEGRVAYHGPAADVTGFMSSTGYECPVNYNPADYIIHTLAVCPGREKSSREKINYICDLYDDSVYHRSIEWHLENMTYTDTFTEEMHELERDYRKDRNKNNAQKKHNTQYNTSWWTQFSWCYWRNMLDMRRNKQQIPRALLYQLLNAFTLGLVFFQQTYDERGVMNLNSAILLMCIQVTFGTAAISALSFGIKFPVFKREYQDRMYCSSAYYISQLLTDLPIIIIGATLYSCGAYWLIGYFNHMETFLVFVAALILLSMVASGIGHLLGAMTESLQLVVMMVASILILLLLFSGLLLKSSDMLFLFRPLEWVSPYHYAYEALVIDQWQHVKYIACTNTSTTCFANGETVLRSLQIKEGSIQLDFVCNFALFLGFELLGMIALHLRAKRK